VVQSFLAEINLNFITHGLIGNGLKVVTLRIAH
jgi:hypothetical protein